MLKNTTTRRRFAYLPVLAMALVVLSTTGCGQLVRKAPSQLDAPVAQHEASDGAAPSVPNAPVRGRLIPDGDTEANPADAPESNGTHAAPGASGCRLQIFAEPVSIARYSKEGLTVQEHVDIVGCPLGGPFSITVGGGRGSLKKVASGAVKYYPPTRSSDPDGRVTRDVLDIEIECPHGNRVKTRMFVDITESGRPAQAQARDDCRQQTPSLPPPQDRLPLPPGADAQETLKGA